MRAGEDVGVGERSRRAPRAVPGMGQYRPGSAQEEDKRGFERGGERREEVSGGKGEVEEGVMVRRFGGERRERKNAKFVDKVCDRTVVCW